MSICPICGNSTSDPCGMGSAGTGCLPEWLRDYDEEGYVIHASEGAIDYWADNVKSTHIMHSYSIERRHVLCDTCKLLQYLVKYEPDRVKKVQNAIGD